MNPNLEELVSSRFSEMNGVEVLDDGSAEVHVNNSIIFIQQLPDEDEDEAVDPVIHIQILARARFRDSFIPIHDQVVEMRYGYDLSFICNSYNLSDDSEGNYEFTIDRPDFLPYSMCIIDAAVNLALNDDPLWHAVLNNDLQGARALLESGADPNKSNAANERVLKLAVEWNRVEMVALLLAYNASISTVYTKFRVGVSLQHHIHTVGPRNAAEMLELTKKATILDLGYLEDYINGIHGQKLDLPHQRRILSPTTLKDRCMALLFGQMYTSEMYTLETDVERTLYNICNSLNPWKVLVRLEFERDEEGYESSDEDQVTRELSNYTDFLDIMFDKFHIRVYYNPKGDVYRLEFNEPEVLMRRERLREFDIDFRYVNGKLQINKTENITRNKGTVRFDMTTRDDIMKFKFFAEEEVVDFLRALLNTLLPV